MDIHIFYTELSSQVASDIYQKLLQSFPQPLSEKIMQYTDEQERRLRIAGKGLLAYALKDLGLYPAVSLEQYAYSATHQPLLLHTDVQFSISHSGHMIVCAVAKGAVKLGIDIERLKPVRLDLMKFYFDGSSWQEIIAAPDTSSTFYKHWTMREAAIKASGLGIEQMELSDIVTEPDNTIQVRDETYYGHMLPLRYDYMACLATSKEPGEIRLTELSAEALL